MMATTHALAGLVLGAVVATVAPDVGAAAVFAGAAGGAVTDLDLYAGHRRTLHYPLGYPLASVPAGAVALAWPTTATVVVATFLAAAALHAASDVLGGGLELRPWEANSERAVYDHLRGRWIPPRRWVRYDGAPEDLLLAGGLAVPSLVLAADVDPLVVPTVGGLLAVSAGYAVIRRRIPALTETATVLVPPGLRPYLPDRFLRNR